MMHSSLKCVITYLSCFIFFICKISMNVPVIRVLMVAIASMEKLFSAVSVRLVSLEPHVMSEVKTMIAIVEF